jgi:hypothetical protein
MKPIADELVELERGVRMTVRLHDDVHQPGLHERNVQAYLILVSCDAPGLRKILGFAGFAANDHFCTKCKRTKAEMDNFSLPPAESKTLREHNDRGAAWKKLPTEPKRDAYSSKHGYRYNPFCDLQYFDSVRFHVIDAMHSLLLGSGKHLLHTMSLHGMFLTSDFHWMQQMINSVHCPREVGSVPYKIASHMAHLKADQVTRC